VITVVCRRSPERSFSGGLHAHPRGRRPRTDRRECARSPWPHVSLSVMARPGVAHRAAAPSCTPATRDRTGRLHRDVHGRPAACRNPGLLDDSGLASASRPRIARDRRHPAGSPAIPEPGPRVRRHPGVPAGLPFTRCAVTLNQLHRQGGGPRAAGTTDGGASATAVREDPVGGRSGRRL